MKKERKKVKKGLRSKGRIFCKKKKDFKRKGHNRKKQNRHGHQGFVHFKSGASGERKKRRMGKCKTATMKGKRNIRSECGKKLREVAAGSEGKQCSREGLKPQKNSGTILEPTHNENVNWEQGKRKTPQGGKRLGDPREEDDQQVS